jgi:cell division protein FtsB
VPTTTPKEQPRPVLTGRALVLGVLVIGLVVVLASPVKRYLGSRHDVGTAATQLQHDRTRLAQLARQKARWSDPGYVQQQARKRLQFAMPGDTVYIVVDKGQQSDIERTRTGPAAGSEGRDAWNQRLWSSVRAAAG